ncbi:MAG TPA: hypothetical protein VKX25_14805 [Bryobacteraceae bacterium]|jgi:hypothetical protein|nr:hypothetical protein [Bryobacteraceae bacterium]
MLNVRSDNESSNDPRWSAVLALLAVGGLYYAMPDPLTLGPGWLLPAVIVLLLVPAMAARRAGYSRLNYVLGLLLSAVITIAMIWSLALLIAGLLQKRQAAPELLRGAVALWFTNILVFASWYWRLDAGGPNARADRAFHTEGDFLFPQMMLPPSLAARQQRWKPGFVDYLFLAFNTSTAFSPTDVPVLSRWAKILMMIQSVISLGTIALVAARAVNIL